MLRTTQSLRRFGSQTSTAQPSRRLQCRAVRQSQELGRRAMLLSTATPLLFTFVQPAMALLLDEEDEELVEKAKANRKNKLAEQRKTTQEFLQAEGLKDVKLDQELIPIQKGIFKLAESGSKLEGGDVRAASSILSESWSSDFVVAVSREANADAVSGRLQELKAAASKGDARASKSAYVALVSELQSWSEAAGVASKLKGL